MLEAALCRFSSLTYHQPGFEYVLTYWTVVTTAGHLLFAQELDEFATIHTSARTMLRALFGEVGSEV